jgi:hypothetical protein
MGIVIEGKKFLFSQSVFPAKKSYLTGIELTNLIDRNVDKGMNGQPVRFCSFHCYMPMKNLGCPGRSGPAATRLDRVYVVSDRESVG